MARGPRRSKTVLLQEQITGVQESIVKKEAELKALKSREKELRNEFKKMQIDELGTLIEEKNLSVEDIKSLIEKKA